MRKGLVRVLSLTPLFLSLGLEAGEIKGVVRDSKTKEALGGVMVMAKSPEMTEGATALTEENGSYSFPGLKPGTYTVSADFAGATAQSTATIVGEESVTVALAVMLSKAKAEAYVIEATGTRLPTTAAKALSPVTSVGRTDVDQQGSTRVEDVINSLPQAFLSQNATTSNGSNGTATVNLRNLGSSRTLVLIDGRRLGPGNPNAFSTTPVVGDLNFIPTPLVDRIDILTGGSSAVYGADAVAGVVNFVTKKDFEGVQLDLGWNFYQHGQQQTALQQVLRDTAANANDPTQFTVPPDQWNLMGPSISVMLGVNSPDGKGNITAYAAWRRDHGIIQATRDFSACTFNSGDTFTCGGSGSAAPARIGGFTVDTASDGTAILRPRVAATDIYNFGPLNFYLRPDDRYNLGATGHYEIAKWADAYAQVMFLDDRSPAQVAPSGIFASPQTINCDNPLLTAQQRATMCPAATPGDGSLFTGTVARRNVEGGGRLNTATHSAYRILTGVKGQFLDHWSYDAYTQYMATNYLNRADNYFDLTKVANALIAVPNPAYDPNQAVSALNRPVVCQSVIDGTDLNCVPYNIFSEAAGAVTADQLNYLQVPAFEGGYGSERVLNANVVGDLGGYGIRVPMAREGIALSAGGEYRHQSISYFSDSISASGNLSGSGAASLPIDRTFGVWELFGEMRLPLVQDRTLFKDLTLEAGYRYSNYSFNKDTHTYKAGYIWELVDGLRFRNSLQRSVRAPAISELYAPQVVALDGSTDPCALQGYDPNDPNVAAAIAACQVAFPGIDPLTIEENPAAQYNGLVGGNPNLEPELSDTVSVGIAFQPSFIPGLQITADYFNIAVNRAIGVVGADVILNNCLLSADPNSAYCRSVVRDANGSIWLSNNGYVNDPNVNLGAYRTDGIDFYVGYDLDFNSVGLKGWGSVFFSMNGTWLNTSVTQSTPDAVPYDCAGLFGSVCLNAQPQWRHKMRATWLTPIGLEVSAQWRYLSAVTLDALETDQPTLNNPGLVAATDLFLGSRNYLDLYANYSLWDMFTFRFGVNNVIDQDPPLIGQDNGGPASVNNGNTMPGVYDALGRYFFMSASLKFL